MGRLLITHLLYTIQYPLSAAKQSSSRNRFHPLLFFFWWTRTKRPRSRLRKRIYGWGQLHCGSAVSYPSLVHSSRSDQHSETIQFPKKFPHSSLYFLVDQVEASLINTEEETLWVKLNPLQVSHKLPISYTQIKIRSAQQDSPVSQIVFTLFSVFFGGPSLIASQITTVEETLWMKPAPLLVSH